MSTTQPDHLADLFDATAPALLLFARQWLDRGLAEDAVQDAFVRLLNQRRSPDNPRAWLFRTVRNGAISAARSTGRRSRREMSLVGTRDEWFDPRTDDLIDASVARAALESLPGEQREVIVMRIWAQMTLAEISEVTGDAVSTLFSRYKAGLAAIKQKMESTCRINNPT